ncbi:carbohydrate sulfotransferase 4-like [Anomaloglossus baeobatrachus]|uniref:carbohydrate sulfotransferase 4-like n=1 Tax=Anomaloglossus baeobatrachus TaxID=238106 RepID=UPI003F4F4630
MAPRLSLFRFIIVSLLIFFSVWILKDKIDFEDQEGKRTHVLILSSWRSGSSFLGQIFNHHPNVFYIYEPARMVWVKFPNLKASVLHYPIRDLFRSLFTCDVSPLHEYLSRGGRYISDLPFWTESWALCSQPACKALNKNKEYDRPTCFQRCGYVPLKKMEESCEVHSHVVLKTVRILDLGPLVSLLEDANLDLRIIHLVRDPRAVALSRLRFKHLNDEDLIVVRENEEPQNKKSKPSVTQVMAKICEAQVAINNFSRRAGKALQGKYMMIRHEDLATEPLTVVDKVYKFTGLSLNKDLQKLVYNITHRHTQVQRGFMNFAEDSMKIVHKWRKDLNHKVVLEIQDVCHKAMEVFGYGQVRTLKEQHDLSLSVVNDVMTDK